MPDINRNAERTKKAKSKTMIVRPEEENRKRASIIVKKRNKTTVAINHLIPERKKLAVLSLKISDRSRFSISA